MLLNLGGKRSKELGLVSSRLRKSIERMVNIRPSLKKSVRSQSNLAQAVESLIISLLFVGDAAHCNHRILGVAHI